MSLFDQLVTQLTDDQRSLTQALLETKVLMHRIGHNELVPWIDHELNGYPRHGAVPPYRRISAQLRGTLENGIDRRPDVDLVTFHLPEKLKARLCSANLGHSVAELEEMVAAQKAVGGKLLAESVPPEFLQQLSRAYKGVYVSSAKSVVGSAQIAGVLTQIRSRLLSFVLTLQSKLGPNAEDDLKQAAVGINVKGMLNGAMIGDYATFVFGDHNTVSTAHTVSKGNLGELHRALEQAGVEPSDLAALDEAIHADGDGPLEKQSMGPRVATWVGAMVSKAASGGWAVTLGAAGNLLSSAISNYYGLGGS